MIWKAPIRMRCIKQPLMSALNLPNTNRKLHRVIGITMLLPFIAWSLTGLFFLIQPGYGDAYAPLAVKTYGRGAAYTITANPEWLETRHMTTILGSHLLVRTASGWQHLHADDASVWEAPDAASATRLFEDAIATNKARYGNLLEVSDLTALTDKGVALSLNWNTLTLGQYGRDTRWIDRLYSIHYLEWTGIDLLDSLLGLVGLALLLFMTYTGGRLAYKKGDGGIKN